ncbi:MAG TPA: PDZ domain-containing protein, partial [Acidobacteriota bacterium]|nr:PDZ domain-containing protein [Acidobacteriota bacterium]
MGSMVSRIKLTILCLSSLIVVYGLVGGMLDKVSARDDAYRDLSVFSDVLSKIRDEYVEDPDMTQALEGALHGMMEALDPYSSFVDAGTYKELKGREEDGASPGLVISKRYGYVYIVSVDEGSSAQQQGLRTGDLIESIEGRQTTVMSLWEAQHRLMGPEGSTVDLRVIRSRRSEPYEVSLTRHPITPMEVTARIVDGNIGLLRIPGFLPGTAETVKSKLRLLESSGAKGLLVDVRGT